MVSVPTTSEAPQTMASCTQNFEYEIRRMRALKKFINLNPPFFEGGSDPLEAETWLDTIKTMFDSIEILPEYRIGFAGYLFEGAAEEWWDKKDYEKDSKTSENTRWKRFELVFRRMYCRPPNWDAKTRFLNLIQGNKSVSEYIAEFEATLRCCDLSMQADLVSKRAKFMTGLKKKISVHIQLFKVTDFDTLVDVALGVEADLSRRASVRLASCFLCGSEDPKMCACPSRQLKEMTVAQYRAEFAEYYRSSTTNIEAGRVLMSIRFRCGLFPPIKSVLRLSKYFHDFDTLVAAAESAEAVIEQRKEEKRKEKEDQGVERLRQQKEEQKKKEEQRVERQRQQEEEQKKKEDQQVERLRQQQEEQKQESEKKREEKQKKHLETLKQQQEMPKLKKKPRGRPNLMPSFGVRCPFEPENKMPKVEFAPKKRIINSL